MTDRDASRRLDEKTMVRESLGIERPWRISRIEELGERRRGELVIHLEYRRGAVKRCPHCGARSPGYDTLPARRWQHTRMWGRVTHLSAKVPRVRCPEHGVSKLAVPWADDRLSATRELEAEVIGELREGKSIATVSSKLGLGWGVADGIRRRAVERGLARRASGVLRRRLCVDEFARRKGHTYGTLVTDMDTGAVLHVGEGRRAEALEGFYRGLSQEQLEAIECVSMDMWEAYVSATLKWVPDARSKICYDRFHVAKHLGDAVNDVRRQEHVELLAVGDGTLKRTRFTWLKNPRDMPEAERARFSALLSLTLKTSRAWRLKELARELWAGRDRQQAERGWLAWCARAQRSRLGPVVKAARMVRRHLWGIVNAMALGATNAMAESINSKVKKLKVICNGFRNKERFKEAIYFHLGGLDLMPDGVR